MTNDIMELRQLNEDINKAENEGDRDKLSSFMAPHLAFQRANEDRTIDDLGLFLQKVKRADESATRTIEVGYTEVYEDRAVVTCIVTQGGDRFHNIRLFVKVKEKLEAGVRANWKLLGWANKKIADSEIKTIKQYDDRQKSDG
jgi:hypothetical protein